MILLTLLFNRTHEFDKPKHRQAQPKRKSGGVSDLDVPGRGAEGYRPYHKFNEEKCLAHRRSEIPDEQIESELLKIKST